MYNRFGTTEPLRVGRQFHDTGLLQDMYNFKYRPYAYLSPMQRKMGEAAAVYPTNFMAYARVHAITALASCNHGTQDPSIPRIARNLYRMYVDTYECMGRNPEDDGVPVMLGFNVATRVTGSDQKMVTAYAGTLACINSKLEQFCASDANAGQRVCQNFKQVYLNDATLHYMRQLRAGRGRRGNLRGAAQRTSITRKEFDDDIELQGLHRPQSTLLSVLIENGADFSAPLQHLEPRALKVSPHVEDDDVHGNDFFDPSTRELVRGMDFGEDNLSKTQLAVLSLVPLNYRVLGTMRLTESTRTEDLEYLRKRIFDETVRSRKKVWQRYLDSLIGGAFGRDHLLMNGPVDYDVDFDVTQLKNPYEESLKVPKKAISSVVGGQTPSILYQNHKNVVARVGMAKLA